MSLKQELEKNGTYWTVKKGTPLEAACILTLHQAWGTDPQGYFPGPQPTSIERKHFDLLKKSKYMVCEKNDGERHVLVAFMYNKTKVCVLINRSLSCTLVQNTLGKTTTVLDGELINNVYCVHDAIVVDGVDVKKLPLTQRLEEATKIVDKILKLKTDVFLILVKKMYAFEHMNTFIEYYKTLKDVDGIVLTPVNDPIQTGTHDTMFKWKPQDKNTIDFLIKKTRNKWSMYVTEKGSLVFESELLEKDAPEWITDNCIAECQYMHTHVPRWWKPLNIRRDKSHPNNRRTFYRTLNNIRENIQLHELIM